MTNIKSVTFVGKAKTHDLEVDHPDHQFYLANGILTSNSHATLYSMISFHTAYLKANYPIEFMVANLISEVHSNAKSSKENIAKIKAEIRNKKVKIIPPDLNKSELSWKIVDDHTLMTGLDSLKYIGTDSIPELISKRPFVSYLDLIYRTDSRKVRSPSIQALAASGSLDSFGMDRKIMFLYATDFRAKLRSHMDKLDRIWEKEMVKLGWEDCSGSDETTARDFTWKSPDGVFSNLPEIPEERIKAHLETFKYPFPDIVTHPNPTEAPWSIQELFALEEMYIGEGISGTVFERYPGFFHPNKTIPFNFLATQFPWKRINEDERLNRKANSYYLGNEKIPPLEAVITSVFSFTVKKEDSPIFGQEMARFTIQDPWGDESSLLAFPEAWASMKERISTLSSGKQEIVPGLAIRFLAMFQWENEHTSSLVLSDILTYKAPPSVPEDLNSRKVKMSRQKKVTPKQLELFETNEDLVEALEEEFLDEGMSTVDDEDTEL